MTTFKSFGGQTSDDITNIALRRACLSWCALPCFQCLFLLKHVLENSGYDSPRDPAKVHREGPKDCLVFLWQGQITLKQRRIVIPPTPYRWEA